MKAYDIEWDCPESVKKDLPTEIEIPDELVATNDNDTDVDAISDYLSDTTGYCHYGFLLKH